MTDAAMAARVAQVIREAREAKGWSKPRAANAIGCAVSVYRQWEDRRHIPRLQLWPHIVAGLDISPERERWAVHGEGAR